MQTKLQIFYGYFVTAILLNVYYIVKFLFTWIIIMGLKFATLECNEIIFYN